VRSGAVGQTVSVAYDAIAEEYDRQLENDFWMRRILWKQYGKAFHPGHHVLDVGCGTGTDAIFLAQRGVRVTAIDISPGMIAQAETKVARQGLSGQVRLALLDIGEMSGLTSGDFDGIISSFAALNSLPTLMQFAADSARLLRPHGRMILHLLNGSSLWEWARLMAHGRFQEARLLSRRRERIFDVGGQPVLHYMPRADEAYARYFATHFRLCGTRGLGITRPPHPIGHTPEPVLSALGRLDEFIGVHRRVAGWGRFVVLDMVKDVTARTE
jgi:ubiquinone/menaquinone biosynthesis C-methylase UbiE